MEDYKGFDRAQYTSDALASVFERGQNFIIEYNSSPDERKEGGNTKQEINKRFPVFLQMKSSQSFR